MTIYDFKEKDIDGNEVDFSIYRDKVLLIVNTATKCGFTPQYEGLQKLYDTYKDKGFEVLGFPCNSFAGQAPGEEAEIKSFCSLKYNVTFTQFSKIKVNGKDAEPLYNFLKQGEFAGRIMWNFTKFLIDRAGNVVGRFDSKTKPEDIEKEIVKIL
ncbi:MAG: glutathione peroxidase [Clostridia bacterium]|nr:glutathione peroxidase [Clostridia bacterium]